MAVRSDSTQLIAGAVLSSAYAGLGVLGANVPSSGADGPSALYPCLSLPADNAVEFMGQVTREPVNGTMARNEDWSFTYTGTADYCDFRLFIAGVAATADIGYGPGIVRVFFDAPGGGSGVIGAGPSLADATVGGGFGSSASAMGAGPRAADATVGGGMAGYVAPSGKPGKRTVVANTSTGGRADALSTAQRPSGTSARRPSNRARS